MSRSCCITILTAFLSCETAGADAVTKGAPTTAAYLAWLAEAQAPRNTRVILRRRIPDAKFDADHFRDCIDWLRDLTGSNLVFDTNAFDDARLKQSIPITLRKKEIPFADLLRVILDQADPMQHRFQFAAQDEFILISTADRVRSLEGFERRYRPASHDFRNLLNHRILIECDPLAPLGDPFGLPSCSMQFDDEDIVAAVEQGISRRANVPIHVDWKEIDEARLFAGSKISLRFSNLTTFDALTLILEQVYDLDCIRISCDANAIYVNMGAEPATKPPEECPRGATAKRMRQRCGTVTCIPAFNPTATSGRIPFSR